MQNKAISANVPRLYEVRSILLNEVSRKACVNRPIIYFLPTYIPYPKYSKRFLGIFLASFMILLYSGLLMYRDSALNQTPKRPLNPYRPIILINSL